MCVFPRPGRWSCGISLAVTAEKVASRQFAEESVGYCRTQCANHVRLDAYIAWDAAEAMAHQVVPAMGRLRAHDLLLHGLAKSLGSALASEWML